MVFFKGRPHSILIEYTLTDDYAFFAARPFISALTIKNTEMNADGWAFLGPYCQIFNSNPRKNGYLLGLST